MNAPATAPKVHQRYVERVRGRLSKPQITVEDARDGVLDCFVSTYHEGLAVGLQGVVGVEASPDEVARVAAGLFRKRLRAHGASFETPTIEALIRVKAEVDEELHFHELPAELRGTHDRVCELLLSKADGLMPHEGDRSALRGTAATASSPASTTAIAPAQAAAPPHVAPPSGPHLQAASSRPPGARPSGADVMREAIATLLDELAQRARGGETLPGLMRRLDKARRLVESVHEIETP